MQDLTEKNTQLSQELQECKSQLEAALAAAEGCIETPPVNTLLQKRQAVCGLRVSLTMILQMVPDWIRTSNTYYAS